MLAHYLASIIKSKLECLLHGARLLVPRFAAPLSKCFRLNYSENSIFAISVLFRVDFCLVFWFSTTTVATTTLNTKGGVEYFRYDFDDAKTRDFLFVWIRFFFRFFFSVSCLWYLHKSLLFKSALIRKRKGTIRSFWKIVRKFSEYLCINQSGCNSVKRSTVIKNWRISADILEFSNNGIPVTLPLQKNTPNERSLL